MMDPEAAHIVLACIESPLTIVPWETCIDGEFNITLVCEYISSLLSKYINMYHMYKNCSS